MAEVMTDRLVGHAAALGSLLDALLAEVPAYTPGEVSTVTSEAPSPAQCGTTAGPRPTAELNPHEVPPLTHAQAGEAEPPVWARNGFRALLFRIGDLDFAIPLLMLRAVARLELPLRQVPQQPAWHRGVTHYRGDALAVADLGVLLGIAAGCEAPRYLLLLGDGRVAIGCDALGEAPGLDAGAVRWRRGGDDKAWFAGLLSAQMCVLLDATAIDQRIRHG
jgi:purine-binding chemotaxis protein CheW